jgi:hypothetical protein
MLYQGPGGLRFFGSGTDACRVDEPVLQLGREETGKLHTFGGRQIKGTPDCELGFSIGDGLRDALGSIWLDLALHLIGDPKAIEQLDEMLAGRARWCGGDRLRAEQRALEGLD